MSPRRTLQWMIPSDLYLDKVDANYSTIRYPQKNLWVPNLQISSLVCMSGYQNSSLSNAYRCHLTRPIPRPCPKLRSKIREPQIVTFPIYDPILLVNKKEVWPRKTNEGTLRSRVVSLMRWDISPHLRDGRAGERWIITCLSCPNAWIIFRHT